MWKFQGVSLKSNLSLDRVPVALFKTRTFPFIFLLFCFMLLKEITHLICNCYSFYQWHIWSSFPAVCSSLFLELFSSLWYLVSDFGYFYLDISILQCLSDILMGNAGIQKRQLNSTGLGDEVVLYSDLIILLDSSLSPVRYLLTW